jgi:hypothetical protein
MMTEYPDILAWPAKERELALFKRNVLWGEASSKCGPSGFSVLTAATALPA